MKLIANPKALAEHIVIAVCADLYERSGGDYFFDAIPGDVLHRELAPELVAVVQRELEKRSPRP